MKKLWMVLLVIVIAGVFFIVYNLAMFDLLPVDKMVITQVTDQTGNIFKVLKVTGNATTGDVLQLVKERKNTSDLIFVVESYGTIQSIGILNDSIVELIVKKEGYQYVKVDTFLINTSSGRVMN